MYRRVRRLLGLHEELVLLKDLPNPPRPNKTYMNNKREIRQNNVENLEGPIPYGFTWGLVPPTLVGIFMPKSK
jgi:sulfite exporter TauE/SafE